MKIVSSKEHFLHCNVAGFTYHSGCEVFPHLSVGTVLQLVREDQNAYDPRAIAVFYGDTHLGYVPRTSNEQLAMFFDLGYADLFEARIQQLDPAAHPEEQVQMVVYLKRRPAL